MSFSFLSQIFTRVRSGVYTHPTPAGKHNPSDNRQIYGLSVFQSLSNTAPRRKKAAGLVIGNEILTGKTLDMNTQVLAQFLFARGITLARCETIPDDIPMISKTVSRLAATHDYVFTSGGIGPTLDDVTYEAVGAAYNAKLILNQATVQRMRKIAPTMKMNEARLRMAMLPEGCEIFWTDELWVPTVCVGGKVFVLPGIPRLYKAMLHALPGSRVSAGGLSARASAELDTRLPEGDVAELLLKVSQQYPDVSLGSYPKGGPNQSSYTKLVIEADDEEEVSQALAVLSDLVHEVEMQQSS